jgi:two-component system sensor histidine kinase DesK
MSQAAEVSGFPGHGPRRRALPLLAAHTVWLWFLTPPAAAITRGQVQPAPVAAAGLAAFAALYLALVAVPVAGLAVPPARHAAGLALLALLGLGLTARFAGGPEGWLVLPMYVCSAGAVGLPRAEWAFAWIGAAVAAVPAIGVAHRLPLDDTLQAALVTALSGSVTLGFAGVVRLVEKLRATQQELARTVVERERLRFAQDLHDLLGHTLSLVVVKAEVVRRLAPADPHRAAAEAADIERIGRTALSEVREAVTGYRERDFRRELDHARTVLTDVGIAVTVRETGHPLAPAAGDTFRWVLREGVTNVLRHSRASRCEITVGAGPGGSVLSVRDDGVGMRPEPGNGLRGLTDRVVRAGGQLEVGPASGGGLLLTARLPAGSCGPVTA